MQRRHEALAGCLRPPDQPEIGLDQIVTTPGAGWHEPHDRVIESIHLTGAEVIPHLRATAG